MTSLPGPTSGEGTQRFCARRSNQWLEAEELEAHLAALVRLENVGVLLGAGASMGPLGGKTMKGIWESYESEFPDSFTWLNDNKFLPSSGEVNVEELADLLEIAHLEWTRAKKNLTELKKARSDLKRSILKAALLVQQWWEEPLSVTLDTDELSSHRQLLQKLASTREPGQSPPWVFTTNYDIAVEWAAESINLKVTNGFDGLHNRVFSPHNFDLGYRNMLARGEARFGTYSCNLVKLHGSLSWVNGPDGTPVECSTAYLWPKIARFLDGTDDDAQWQLVFPRAAKYLQTVGFVMGELYRRFSEFVSRPQSCLITSGYSFSDGHLNRVLLTALQNPTLQLVIYVPEACREGESLKLDGCSPWVKRVEGLKSPQVTIVGGGEEAHFNRLAEQLPAPAIYDEQAAKIREMIKQFRGASPKNAGDGGAVT